MNLKLQIAGKRSHKMHYTQDLLYSTLYVPKERKSSPH